VVEYMIFFFFFYIYFFSIPWPMLEARRERMEERIDECDLA
jgi:hypothetical protein